MNAEIAEEVGLVTAGGFEAASGHEEKDDRAMEFVATTNVESGLVLGGMESSLGIELYVPFES